MAAAALLEVTWRPASGTDGPRLAGAAAAAIILHASVGALVLLGPWRAAPLPALPEGVTIELATLPSSGDADRSPEGAPEGDASVASTPDVPPQPMAPPEAQPSVAPPPVVLSVSPPPPVPPVSLAALQPQPPPLPAAVPPPVLPLTSVMPAPAEALGDIAPAPIPAAETAPVVPPIVVPPEPSPPATAAAPQSVGPRPESAPVAEHAEPLPLPPPAMPAPQQSTVPRPLPAAPQPRLVTRTTPRGSSDGAPEARPLAHGGGSNSLPAGGAAPSDDPPLITAPRFRRPPRPPEYPRRAVELDLTGTVVVRALLDPEGDPREMRVHRSSGHPLLDGAALAAVRGWAFQPAARNGQRIPAWVEVPVHFRLQ